MRIPFSVYDFFGYLASGFLLLAATDYAFNGHWLLKDDLELVYGLFWIVVAYITGHINANISGHLLEKKIVRGLLSPPEKVLFQSKTLTGWARIFPGFYEPLPQGTQKRIRLKAKKRADIDEPGRALFFHCFAFVKQHPATLERLNTFLNLYGFCRNVSMSSFIAVPVLLLGTLAERLSEGTLSLPKLWWAGAATIAGMGMFYRYLKFFRHYTVEVLITYAEVE